MIKEKYKRMSKNQSIEIIIYKKKLIVSRQSIFINLNNLIP